MNFLLLGAVGAIQSQKCESLLHLLSFCSVYSLFSLIHSFLSFILSFIFGFFLKLANQMQQFHQSSSTPCVILSSTPSFPCVLFPSFLLSLFLSHFFIYPLRLLNSNICKQKLVVSIFVKKLLLWHFNIFYVPNICLVDSDEQLQCVEGWVFIRITSLTLYQGARLGSQILADGFFFYLACLIDGQGSDSVLESSKPRPTQI